MMREEACASVHAPVNPETETERRKVFVACGIMCGMHLHFFCWGLENGENLNHKNNHRSQIRTKVLLILLFFLSLVASSAGIRLRTPLSAKNVIKLISDQIPTTRQLSGSDL